jgi:hypothetical protein
VVLISPGEDFEGKTLRAVPGLLGKLRYVVTLLNKGIGAHSHWGLERVHGSHNAKKAMRASHGALIAQILKTPLRDLARDLEHSAASAQTTDYELLAALDGAEGGVAPGNKYKASAKHFNSVLHTLFALAQNRASASHPDASPPPPPDQSLQPPAGA